MGKDMDFILWCSFISLAIIINDAFTLKLNNEHEIINRTNILMQKKHEDYQVLKGK